MLFLFAKYLEMISLVQSCSKGRETWPKSESGSHSTVQILGL